MTLKHTGLAALGIFLFSATTSAQMAGLKIGEKIPNIELTQLSNYKSPKARLYDFKNDLLIIDFWATWCGPCIGMFSKVDSIEKTLEHKVRFLPVSYEDRKKVTSFLKSMNTVKKIDVFSVVEDTILSRLFPYQSLPHYVWIDRSGTIIAITDRREITLDKVKLMTEGKKPDITMKTESLKAMNIMQTAFNESVNIFYGEDTANKKPEFLPKDKIMYRSVFTSSIPGIHGYSHWESNSYTFINASPLLLLKEYWGLKKKYGYDINDFLGEGRSAMEVRDTMTVYKLSGGYLNYLYNSRAWEEWGNKYSICYELVVPDSTSLERKEELMEQDLRRYFKDIYKVTFQIERRKVKLLVLRQTSTTDRLLTSGDTSSMEYSRYNFNIQNRPFRYFVRGLKDVYRNSYPIVDETKISTSIDLRIEADILDYNALNIKLATYGLQLFLEEREMDVLVVKDAD